MPTRDEEFAEYFSARFSWARRIAFALSGSWTDAEEIAQQAFVRVYARWAKVRADTVDAYLRTVLTGSSSTAAAAVRRARRPSPSCPNRPCSPTTARTSGWPCTTR